MARHRRKDGAVPTRVAADAADPQRAGMMARLVEKAGGGDVSAAALVVMLHLTREQRLDLVAVANALDVDIGDDDHGG